MYQWKTCNSLCILCLFSQANYCKTWGRRYMYEMRNFVTVQIQWIRFCWYMGYFALSFLFVSITNCIKSECWLHNLGKTNHSWHILEQNIVILTTRKVQNGSESGPKWQKKCFFLVRTQKITLFRGCTPKVGVPLRRHRKNVSDYGLYWHVRTLIWRSEKVFWQKSPKNCVFWNSHPKRASMWNIAQIPRVKK